MDVIVWFTSYSIHVYTYAFHANRRSVTSARRAAGESMDQLLSFARVKTIANIGSCILSMSAALTRSYVNPVLDELLSESCFDLLCIVRRD
jgi:ABC-type transport system involved in Fe-S cluster assembly fused permease/ATPase subunit